MIITYGLITRKELESLPSFFIAEIMRCQLHGNKLSWWRTRFKLVAYISNLLGSNDVKYNILDEELKEMLNMCSDIAGS